MWSWWPRTSLGENGATVVCWSARFVMGCRCCEPCLAQKELEQPVQSVRSDLIDRYVGLGGSIVRAASIAPLITEVSFTCSRCSSEVRTPAVEGRFEYPASCPKKCRFARFSANKDQCQAIDWQRIRLQEDFSELVASGGPQRRMPRTLDCDLKRGLVGSCVPGDAVTLYGVIRCMPTSGTMSAGDSRQAPSKSLYVLYLEAPCFSMRQGSCQ